MHAQFSPFVLPLLVTAALSLAAMVSTLRRRPARGALPLVALMLGSTCYALCYALELASVDLAAKVFWTRIMYVGVTAVPAGLLGFVCRYTDRQSWLRRRTQILLAVEPVITLALLWTNDAHHWVWTRTWLQPYYGSFTTLGVSHGQWFWVHMAYSYGVVLLAVAILGLAFVRSSYLYRRQTAILLVSTLLPVLGDVLVVTGWNPIAPVDPTPFTVALAGIVFAWGLRRFRVFDLLPVARHVVMDRIHEGMVVVNAEGDIVDINAAVLRLLGQKPAQVIGQAASRFLPFYGELAHRHRGEADVHEEVVWKTGEQQCYFDLYMSALHDRHGGLGGYLLVLHDITARKEAEEQVRQRSQELAMLYDVALELTTPRDLPSLLQLIVQRATDLMGGSSGGMYLYRPEHDDLEYTVAHKSNAGLLGTVLQRGQGMSGKVLESGQAQVVQDYSHWPGRASEYEGIPFGAIIAVPMQWEGRILGVLDVVREPGHTFGPDAIRLLTLFANQAALLVARAQSYDAMQKELAERRRAERELQQRSQELSTLYDTVLEVASRLDLAQLLPTIVERAVLLLQATGCGMYLYHPAPDRLEYVVAYGRSEEFIGHSLQRGEGISGKVLESGQPLAVDDYHHWAGRSTLFEGQEVGAVLAVPVKWGERVLGVIDLQRDPGASFTPEDIRLLCLFANQAAIALANAQLYEAAQRELAERKSTETQLRESERRYRAVVEDQTELIYRFTPDGQVTFVNEAACRFLGREREQIVGQSILCDLALEDQSQVQQTLAAITREVPVISMENRVVDGSGQVHWFQWTDRGVFGEDGTLSEYQSVGRDVSERKRAEEQREALQAQLQQAQRMEAVGVLAGGVAHEFNNLLTVILGNVELGMAEVEDNHPLRQVLNTVARTVQRAATLTKQLLAFSRRQDLQRQEVDLNAVITYFGGMLKHALGSGVDMRVNLASELEPILGDAGAIEQVLMNLALNARDAMPDGGVLGIETAAVTLDEAFCRAHAHVRPGEYARLTVSDTGVGMDDATLRRIFEPFFTTKEVGKGTGLGLSILYGIVQQHEGLVEVHSAVGQGSRFDVYLPVYREQ